MNSMWCGSAAVKGRTSGRDADDGAGARIVVVVDDADDDDDKRERGGKG